MSIAGPRSRSLIESGVRFGVLFIAIAVLIIPTLSYSDAYDLTVALGSVTVLLPTRRKYSEPILERISTLHNLFGTSESHLGRPNFSVIANSTNGASLSSPR